MSVQGKNTGNQFGILFAAYNEQEGVDVVDLSRNYNTGDSYATRIGTGNQIDLAFKEINAHVGDEVFSTNNQDWSNGSQLKKLAAKLVLLVSLDSSAPIWLAAMPTEVTINQGDTWPWAASDYIYSDSAVTYAQSLNIPTGITLGSDGSFSGTATNSGKGTLEIIATNANGSTSSEWISWDVLSV